MEDEERWTAEGYKQAVYDCGSNVQRLDESFPPRRESCGVGCGGMGATRGYHVVLAIDEMRRTVVVRFA